MKTPVKTLERLMGGTNSQKGAADKKTIAIVAGVAVVAAVAIGLFVGGGSKDQVAPQGASTAAHAVTAQAPKAESAIRTKVREFFKRDNATPQEAAELLKTFVPQNAEEEDVAYRLMHFAVTGGIKDLYESFAMTIDPREKAWGSIKKNPLKAWRWYKKAGNATKAQAMVDYVKKQAAEGNRAAKEMLKEMK